MLNDLLHAETVGGSEARDRIILECEETAALYRRTGQPDIAKAIDRLIVRIRALRVKP